MRAADTDRNGVLSWAEFKAWYDNGASEAEGQVWTEYEASRVGRREL
jgi:hypothetical protein